MTAAYIVDYLRSPFTPAMRGALAGVRPDDLASEVLKALVARAGVDASEIEDVNLGCAFAEGEQGLNIARCVGLTAGLPQSVGGSTINRWCGSSMQAVQMAAGAIAMGAGDAFIAGGVLGVIGYRWQGPGFLLLTAGAVLAVGLYDLKRRQ